MGGKWVFFKYTVDWKLRCCLNYFWSVKTMFIFYLALFEGTARVDHLYSALVPVLSSSSVFNFTLKVAYIQLKQQLIERIVQKKGKREREQPLQSAAGQLHRVD